MNTIPLIVDLDGTLIHTDMLHESMISAFREKPLVNTLKMPHWLSRGKAFLKQRLAQSSSFNAASLPYNKGFLSWLKQQHAQGRKLILCTASDYVIASAIAAYLNIFDEVMASDGSTNLAHKHKAEALTRRFGLHGFDYAGNSRADLPVWSQARHAIFVNTPTKIIKKASATCKTEKVFSFPSIETSSWQHTLRTHQWLKNILLFIPLLAAHKMTDLHAWSALFFAFISFSLCASAVYIANDLLDLDNDRQHPRKHKRPFASGKVPIWLGFILSPCLLLASIAFGTIAGTTFIICLVAYFILTCAYSLRLKRLVIVDCLTLAILYTLRIIAGAAAVEITLSFWLLAFSIFLFLSLAFVKRYAELWSQKLMHQEKLHGRGYHTTDAPLIQIFGISAAYVSVLVLALYINSDAVRFLYRTPDVIWGVVPLLLFWTNWMWLRAHRGEMHDDPLVFAVKDKASLLTGFLFVLVLVLGTVRWS